MLRTVEQYKQLAQDWVDAFTQADLKAGTWRRVDAFRQRSSRVGSFAANAWGLFDMHGNVRGHLFARAAGRGGAGIEEGLGVPRQMPFRHAGCVRPGGSRCWGGRC